MSSLHDLADAVGLQPIWRDADGAAQRVSDDALVAILGALGHPSESEQDRRRGLDRIDADRDVAPGFLSGDVGRPIALPTALIGTTQAELVPEHGARMALAVAEGMLAPVAEPGYYRLRIAGHELTLAVAPHGCVPIASIADRRLWGPSVQIPALRDEQGQPFGHFGHLRNAAALFAERGADAVAISPVHALYPGDGARFSPYAPSSRLFLNIALADPAMEALPGFPRDVGGALIDWEAAVPQHLAVLRTAFAALGAETRMQLSQWTEEQGDTLRRHATFDALHHHFR
ncbi:MAG: 4-alpha-glucanotransferase, partial [Sphingobium sp.]